MKYPTIHFGVFTLLFLCACIAGLLTGYRVGFQQGKSQWQEYPVMVVTYAAKDLVSANGNPTARLDELVDRIRDDVFPLSWARSGGNCTIAPFPSNLALVVSANPMVHDEVSRLLATLRQESNAGDDRIELQSIKG